MNSALDFGEFEEAEAEEVACDSLGRPLQPLVGASQVPFSALCPDVQISYKTTRPFNSPPAGDLAAPNFTDITKSRPEGFIVKGFTANPYKAQESLFFLKENNTEGH